MTENIKKLLELVSDNEELQTKLTNASKDDLISLAKENGITLTDADFEQSGEISDDELNAVAGGKLCFCALGGGGTGSEGERTCACIVGGGGERKDGTMRCVCPVGGSGGSHDIG